MTINDREALIDAFNQLKENFKIIKEQRNAMKERYVEIQRILYDVQFEKDQFIKEKIVKIIEQLDRQSFYFTRNGTVFHRACLECRSMHEIQERASCSLCIGAFSRTMLRQAREILGIPTNNDY